MLKIAASAFAVAFIIAGTAHADRLSGSGCPVPERIIFPPFKEVAGGSANRLVLWI